MYITDETKEKKAFYDKCLDAHQKDMIAALVDVNKLESTFNDLQEKIDAEKEKLAKYQDMKAKCVAQLESL